MIIIKDKTDKEPVFHFFIVIFFLYSVELDLIELVN